MSLYGYVAGSPIGRLDPYGLEATFGLETTNLCATASCECTSMALEFRTFNSGMVDMMNAQQPGEAPFKGGSLPVIWRSLGEGDHALCAAKRWVLDHTEDDVAGVTRHDAVWQRDGPAGFAPWTTWINFDDGRWGFTDQDAPSYLLGKTFKSGKKSAIYIDYIVNSDGTINPACCRTFAVEISISPNGAASGSVGALMMSPTCAVKAAELEAGDTSQPGRL